MVIGPHRIEIPLLRDQVSVALSTSHALDKDIEAQSLWNLKEIFLFKAKLTCLVVAEHSYLGKFLSIWV